MKRNSVLVRAFIPLIISFALLVPALSAFARTSHPVALQIYPGPTPTVDAPLVARLYYQDPDDLARLAQRLDVWEVHPDQSYLVARLAPEQYSALLKSGYTLEIDSKLTAELQAPRQALPAQTQGIPGFPCYRTVEETYSSLEGLVHLHPQIARWVDFGDSWDKVTPGGPAGYDLRALVLTNQSLPGPKPTFFLMAAIHAREYTTAETATRFAEYLITHYGVDPDITWLLDDYEVHIVPVANPDGRKIAESGALWRKNTDDDDGCTVATSYGTDLNRNSDFKWGGTGASSFACDDTFRGPSPASEPEVQALESYIRTLFPDQRGPDDGDAAPLDSAGLMVSLHSYSQLVLWPWGWTDTSAPNSQQLQTLGRKFAFFNHYTPEQADTLYPTTGATDDWAYGELGIAAYTFEMGTAFFQDCASFENNLYPDNLQALLYALKAARRPYQNPAGPDSLDLHLATEAVAAGASVQLTLTANDTRFAAEEAAQNIQAARYSLDTPSWISGTVTYPLQAADGAFDSPIEALKASLDTAGLKVGRHIVLVESQDAQGNWGVPSAVFLYVVNPLLAPRVEGYVRSADRNQPLAAQVSAGPFTTSTDPTSGYYNLLVISGTYDLQASAPGHTVAALPGTQVRDFETFTRNIYPSPACTIFSDDGESGNRGWSAQLPWAISNEAAHTPAQAWSDSPGANYANNADLSLTSPALDLTDFENIHLDFWHTYALEEPPIYDFAKVEYSTDAGATWTTLKSYSGNNGGAWQPVSLAMPALAGQPQALFRFHLTSDASVNAQGWHIDDIALTGSGPGCSPALPPTAEFNDPDPAQQGAPLPFTDATLGSNPLQHHWIFGDGKGTSTASDPTYLYAQSGTFTVTLTVTNSQGSSQISHPIRIEPSQPVSITQVSLGLIAPENPQADRLVYLYADIRPDEAAKPFTYTLDYGDGALLGPALSSRDPLILTHTFVTSGTFPVSISVANFANPAPVSNSLPITVNEPQIPPSSSRVYLPFL